jgi:serine/threonine-protein phosphatase 2B regulatory subunit
MGVKISQEIPFSQEELLMLEQRFRRLDKDGSGMLEPNEFFDIPELAQNPLVQRVISVFDKNKDGNISFYEFVTGISKLTEAGSEEDKMRFLFSIYDIEGDGFISNGELFKVLKMMVGNNLTDVQLQQLVDRTIIRADEDYDGKISYEEFCKMIRNLEIGDKLTLHFK